MTILALEFSSPQRSVAVARNGRLLATASETGERTTHAFAMMEKTLTDAGVRREEIEVVAVGLGPGSYTGIRVALAIAQGWQLATGVKLLGISSAKAIAAQAAAENFTGHVAVVIDAQRGEFYRATYEIGASGGREITPLQIVTLAEVQAAGETLIGPEVTRWFPSGRAVFPTAAALAGLAGGRINFMPGEKLEPIYLRETTFVKLAAQR
ncbi:MAG: tRNA (adenosine(37)-N6)-threonylcarbamoyltransferase complex dimerization subunit type 1 TsaB [Solirubrobacteraceae bacterium]